MLAWFLRCWPGDQLTEVVSAKANLERQVSHSVSIYVKTELIVCEIEVGA